MSNAKKTVLLGMPFGTATSRLRKAIIFDMLKRYGENDCFQCRRPIDNQDELSIEHKIPWQSAETPISAFFDIGNIAFSHLKCNIKAAIKPKKWSSIREGCRMRARRRRENPEKYALDLARKRKHG